MEDLIAYLKEEIATAPGECFVISKKQAKEVLDKIDINYKIDFWTFDYSEQLDDFCRFLNDHKDDIVSITQKDILFTVFFKSYE